MDSESELLTLLAQITSLGKSTDSDSVRESESKLPSLISQTISHVISMDLDSLPKPDSKLISLVKQIISLFHVMSDSEPESQVVSLITQILNLANSKDSISAPSRDSELISLVRTINSLKPEPEIMSLVDQVGLLIISMYPEWKLISLITRLGNLLRYMDPERESEIIFLVSQVIFLVGSIDLDSLPKPQSELISLVTQVISLFTSISELEPDSELVTLVSQIIYFVNYKDLKSLESVEEAMSLINQLFSLEPEPEIVTLITQIIYLFRSNEWEPQHFISLSPQVEVILEEGKFRVTAKVQQKSNREKECDLGNIIFYRITTGDYTAHLRCGDCNGEEDHEEYEKAPIEVKHRLHPKHSLHLVMLRKNSGTRECSCCDEDLIEIFYYCPVCDFSMNIACVNKPI